MSADAAPWLWALGAIGVLVVATWLHVRFWGRAYARPWRAPEGLEARTADGTRLALHRWPATPGGRGRGAPIILCHGVSCNARTFGVDEDLPMARWLADEGFDVFALDLRGAGESERGGPGARGFDAYVDLDAPAAIEAVCAHTGAARVLWVGHSMGGLIGYQLVADAATRSRVAGLVTLGSPIRALDARPELVAGAGLFVGFRPVLSRVHMPTRFVARLVVPAAGRVRGWPERFFGHPENVPPVVLRRFLAQAVEPVHGSVLDELVLRVRREARRAGGGVADMRAAVRSSGVPVWVCAGSLDRIAPPRACALQRPAPGEPPPVDLLAPRGHCDLVMGRRLDVEVLAPLAAFLETHVARCETTAP